jgi:hypothetical protein
VAREVAGGRQGESGAGERNEKARRRRARGELEGKEQWAGGENERRGEERDKARQYDMRQMRRRPASTYR